MFYQFYQKDWGPVNPLVLKSYVPKQRAKKAAMSVDNLGDLDPERALDAQIEAEECMDEGEAEEAVDEGAMDEEPDGGMDSDVA
jgi:hypothetical protein